METQIVLGVYRRLDNRAEGLSDDSPRALELHVRRKIALHDVLDEEQAVEVRDWGATDDTRSHEYVEIFLGVASAVFKYAIMPGIKFVAEKLAEKAVDEGTSEFVKWLISTLRPKQDAKEISDFEIQLPNGTRIHVDPPDRDAEIRISFVDGTVSSVTYANTK